jgi:16S rRNA (cytosine967-C5)-methyltransferase
VISGAVKLKDFPEFTAGHCEIQDDASQFKAAQVKALPGQIVFDAYAGNGGNGLVFAANMENLGHVIMRDISYENSRSKAAVKKRMKAAGIKNFTLISDSSLEPPTKKKNYDITRLHNKCDWVLVDAPSTGSAVYRKHPELKAAFTEERLRQCVERQRVVFKEALPFVKKLGKIVYATSSIFSDENTAQAEFFCQTYNLEVVEDPLFILPQSNGMNGLFVTVLQRKST